MACTDSVVDRSRSVSSIRSTKRPWFRRASSQLKSAVRAPPMCRYPVGEGANRTRGGVAMTELAGLTAPPRGVNAAHAHPCYASGGVRFVVAVVVAAAALVTGATVPYVRSRTDRTAPDGGHCLG